MEDEIAPISTSRVLTIDPSTCLLLLWMSKKSSCSDTFPTLFRECRTTIEEKYGMCLKIGLCPKIVLLNGKMVINHWILRVSLKNSDKPSCHSCHSPTPPRFQGSLHTRTQQSVDEGRPWKLVSDIGTGKCRELAIEIGNHGKIPVKICEIVENHGKSIGKYPVSDSAEMDMTRKWPRDPWKNAESAGTMGRPSSCEIMESCLEETYIRKMLGQMSSGTAEFCYTNCTPPKASKSVFQAPAKRMFQTLAPNHVMAFLFGTPHGKTSVSFGPKVWRLQHQGVPKRSLLATGCLVRAQWDRYSSCESPLYIPMFLVFFIYTVSAFYPLHTGNGSITNTLVSKRTLVRRCEVRLFFGGVACNTRLDSYAGITNLSKIGFCTLVHKKIPHVYGTQDKRCLKNPPNYTVFNRREQKKTAGCSCFHSSHTYKIYGNSIQAGAP